MSAPGGGYAKVSTTWVGGGASGGVVSIQVPAAQLGSGPGSWCLSPVTVTVSRLPGGILTLSACSREPI
jgi:hypothetical protein